MCVLVGQCVKASVCVSLECDSWVCTSVLEHQCVYFFGLLLLCVFLESVAFVCVPASVHQRELGRTKFFLALCLCYI